MAVWRVHLKSDGKNPFGHCVAEGVIGVGWQVDPVPANRDEYWRLGKEQYGDRAWSSAANAIGWRMQDKDLVWTRNQFGEYFIGKVEGKWAYRCDAKSRAADIVNVRKCKLIQVDGTVPGKVITSFIPARAIQQIDCETIELYSTFLYNRMANDALPLPTVEQHELLNLLLPDDLEDVVALYLQIEKNYRLIPSSRSRGNSTIHYEFRLFNPETGGTAAVQVKSQSTTINPLDYSISEASVDSIYLFSPAGYDPCEDREGVELLAKEVVERFLHNKRDVLPSHIQDWMKLHDELSSL